MPMPWRLIVAALLVLAVTAFATACPTAGNDDEDSDGGTAAGDDGDGDVGSGW